MPEYPNPAGGSMTVANQAEAESRGWTPSMGTFGINSDPNSGGGGGGGSTSSSGGGVDLSAITRGFAASAGMSQKQLDEQLREFDQTLDWQKQMWAQQGLPQLAIQQRVQDLEEKKFAELTQQATRQQTFVEEIGRRQATLAELAQTQANAIASGNLDLARITQAQRNAIESGNLDLAREIQRGQLDVSRGQLGLGQSQLGLQTLQTAAGLTGPADWIKAANYNRGAQQTNLPAFVQKLMTGDVTSVLGGPGGGAQMSAPVTMGSLAGGVGAGAANPFQGQQDILQKQAEEQLRSVYAQGGQALGAQQLEGLTPSEMAMFTGGGSDVGADVPGFVEAYKRSRIGQSASQSAY